MARKKKLPPAARSGPKSPAEAPFFRPFAALAPSGKKGAKAAAAGEATAAAAPKKRPDPIEPPRPPPSPAASTAETFALYMAGVRALDGEAKRIPRTASELDEKPREPKAPREDPDADARARMGSLVLDGLRFEVSDDGERIEGRRVDTDPREVRRLRRGAHAVDGRLDLHGMTAAEAHAAVDAYVRKRRTEGDRVVSIVHGKGSHSPRGVGILRGEIAAWLSQGRAARDVLAFASAPGDEGGTGALLVLLAR
jgi:DNA-nicking Smr family endonuclease